MNEKGFHGTCMKYFEDIQSEGLDPLKCKHRNDHWLGQGVYFFDDYDKALWWASNISEKNKKCGAIIFKAKIIVPDNKVLNLDNRKQLDMFIDSSIEMLKEIEKRCKGKMPIFVKKNFRAFFFDYYKQQHDIAVIVKTFHKDYAGYTKKRNYTEKKMQQEIMEITGLSFFERQICVSQKDYIKELKLVYNEKEEVI